MNGQTKVVIGVVVLTALLIGGLVVFGSKTIPTKLGSITDGPAQLQRDYHPTLGAQGEDVAVTIVEFADFQCPACAASAPLLHELLESESDVQLVFRHFPLDQHLNAETSAAAAEAANVQGKFWDFYDLLFERQPDWAEASDGEEIFEDYAEELGLDLDQFRSDREDESLLNHIRLDKGEGPELGVSGTPTLFINGEVYQGSRDLESLKEAVAAARS